MLTESLALALLLAAPPRAIHLEAENAQLVGVSVSTGRKGYSGKGYVVGFQHDGDKIVFKTPAQGGIYNVRIRYSSPFGPKGYGLVVNGASFSGMFAATKDVFATQAAGKVELKTGLNTVEIDKGWGYFDVDYIELVPATIEHSLKKLSAVPADPAATPRTRALLRKLIGAYGSGTFSGQYGQDECDYIRTITGKVPAIQGNDFMDYSPSRVAFGGMPKDTTEKVIQSAKAGQIVTMSWHWNAPKDLINKNYVDAQGKTVEAPWYKGFYTYATTFNVQYALDHPASEDYRLLLRDIDAIAVQLKKLAAADIPVLWRPLHEAEGGWFWWGAKGPDAYIRLWKLMFNRLTKVHGIHNLLWVHNCVKPEWYPGDAYVDVVGVDAYPSDTGDPLSVTWEDLKAHFDGKKLMALTEFGGVPDVAKMRRYGVEWSYFVSWTGGLGPHKMTKEALTRIYTDNTVLNTR